MLAASESDSDSVPDSGEHPMITHAEPIKVARRAVLVRGNLRISMLVSIGFVEWTPAKGYCHGAALSIRVSMD